MKIQDIYSQLIIYYGIDIKTSEQKLDIVMKWIDANVPESDRAAMISRVFENFTPTSANPYPSIADMKKHLTSSDSDIEFMASKRYNELEVKSNAYWNFITSDVACQVALDSIGGWITFCNRTNEENPWMRKSFIKHYIDAVKNNYNDEPKVYRGMSDYNPKTIMLGDESKCMIALENKQNGETKFLEIMSGLNVN